MSGHLARLALRATRSAAGGLRPRMASMFEQPGGVEPGSLPAVEYGGPTPAVASPVTSRTGLPGEERPTPVPPAPASRAAGRPAVRAADTDTATVEPSAVASVHRDASPADEEASTIPDGPGRRDPQPAGSGPDDRSSLRRQDQAVASLVAEAVSAGLPAPVVPAVDRSPDTEPRTGRPGVRPVRGLTPTHESPRLRPPPRAEQGGAAPSVTVNIGRIEVVPPAPDNRKPPQRPRTPARASGAPRLADYLRGRSTP